MTAMILPFDAPQDALPPLISGATPETRATSTEAAQSIVETKDTQRQRVYEAIRDSLIGLTDDDMQDILGLSGNSQRPRRRELQQLSMIVMRRDGDGSVVRACTRSGRTAVVWVVA